MTGSLYATTLAAALGCGLAAGVFFAFSAFVMDGLEELPPEQGIASMQAINRTALTPLFMAALFGTALLCAGLVVWALASFGEPPAPWVLAAGGLYLIGTILVTVAANVPLNDALVSLDPESADAERSWTRYVSAWKGWNHVRGAAALGAAALLTVGLALPLAPTRPPARPRAGHRPAGHPGTRCT